MSPLRQVMNVTHGPSLEGVQARRVSHTLRG